MDKIALITGGGRGIGAATALRLAELGYAVCVNFRADKTSAEEVVAIINSSGGRAVAVKADVSNEADVERLFAAVDEQLGSITALVNNAGILRPQMRVQDMSAARINEILTTNVTSAFLCSKQAIQRMSTSQGGAGGSIVNVSSAASRLGSAGEYVDYAASKGAIDTFTKGLSVEVAPEGIRVNCVRPGLIFTTMHADGGEPGRVERLESAVPMRRGGTVEEVANSIAWLLSEEASYVTGTFIDASGGR